MITDDELRRLIELGEKATPGPWAVETCGEKGDGSEMIGVVYGPEDENAEHPLSGHLPAFDADGNEIEYYRDELIAECEHRNRLPSADAAFIAAARIAPALAAELLTARAEIARLTEELDTWKSVFPDIAPERVQPDRSKLEAGIERLTRERDAARSTLAQCAIWFDQYTDIHKAKGNGEKAQRNAYRAEFARRVALQPAADAKNKFDHDRDRALRYVDHPDNVEELAQVLATARSEGEAAGYRRGVEAVERSRTHISTCPCITCRNVRLAMTNNKEPGNV